MTDGLRLGLIQTHLEWEKPEDNLRIIEHKIYSAAEHDIFVLPEMFSTGFSMRCETLATEEHNQMCLEAMQRWAKEKNAVITGSIMYKEEHSCRNRLFWAEPGGRLLHYDKRHLFSIGKEPLHYVGGSERLIIEYKGWKIMPLICYDLRFPVWCRNGMSGGEALFDLQLFVANWPAVRSAAWKKLLPARAIENQCFVAALNRVGEDGAGVAHSGDSVVLDYMGEVLASAPPFASSLLSCHLSKETLTAFRQQFPVLLDADPFRL